MTCRKCGGTGFTTVVDYVPYGSASVPMRTSWPCPECLNRGLCPKCGAELVCDGTECPNCDFVDWNLKEQYYGKEN